MYRVVIKYWLRPSACVIDDHVRAPRRAWMKRKERSRVCTWYVHHASMRICMGVCVGREASAFKWDLKWMHSRNELRRSRFNRKRLWERFGSSALTSTMCPSSSSVSNTFPNFSHNRQFVRVLEPLTLIRNHHRRQYRQ